MFRRLDSGFLNALDNPEQFAKRLHQLSIARLVWIFAMIFGVGAFFYTAAHHEFGK